MAYGRFTFIKGLVLLATLFGIYWVAFEYYPNYKAKKAEAAEVAAAEAKKAANLKKPMAMDFMQVSSVELMDGRTSNTAIRSVMVDSTAIIDSTAIYLYGTVSDSIATTLELSWEYIAEDQVLNVYIPEIDTKSSEGYFRFSNHAPINGALRGGNYATNRDVLLRFGQ